MISPLVKVGVLKYPTLSVTVDFSLYGCQQLPYVLRVLGAYICAYIIVISSWTEPLIIMQHPSLSLITVFVLKSILSDEYGYSSFLLISICAEYLFLSLYFQSVSVCRSEVGLLQTAYIWVLLLYAFSQSVSFDWNI